MSINARWQKVTEIRSCFIRLSLHISDSINDKYCMVLESGVINDLCILTAPGKDYNSFLCVKHKFSKHLF